MIAVLARTARLLGAHWPALIAWFLGGTLAHFLVLKLASLVGARSAVGGILLLPVAALALLVGYVAMLLVLRGGMPALSALAPLPDASAARRRAFADGILGGILPFVAFYTAWGFMREDVAAYINGAFEWQFFWGLDAAVSGAEYNTSGTIDDLGFDPLTISLLVGAFVLRWAHQRYRSRLPRWTVVPAVYLEALWVYLAAYLVKDLIGMVDGWVQSRQAIVWLDEFRDGLVGVFAPIGYVWDGIGWVLGEAGGLILLPIAWLTIAGVVYGQAVRAQAPRLSGARVQRVRTHYGRIPQRVRRRIGDLAEPVVGRFRPIGRAVVLMWRAGPLLIGGYVLLFTVVEFAEQWLLVGAGRAIGPHDLITFWIPVSGAVVIVVSLIVEPVRMALVAATYDRTIAELTAAAADAEAADAEAADAGLPAASADDVEVQIDDSLVLVHDGELDHQVVPDVVAEDERADDIERPHRV